MGQNTNIEWTDHTFNAWTGCTKVSPGCANCYAATLDTMRFSKTLGNGTKEAPVSHWGKGSPRHRTSESNWREPLKWNRKAAGAENRPRVFCSSLADWLDEEVPIQWLSDLLYLVVKCSALDWQLLTKRPQYWLTRMTEVSTLGDVGSQIAKEWLAGNAPPNVWLGTTVEDQTRADERVPLLLSIPAKVRFLSVEPMLGPVDLVNLDGFNILCDSGIDWVICGGESGPGCRPFKPEWARSLRDQCKLADVSFFMKQMGGKSKPFAPIPDDLMIRYFPECHVCFGLYMIPGTLPDDDVMNTPCPRCNVKGGTK